MTHTEDTSSFLAHLIRTASDDTLRRIATESSNHQLAAAEELKRRASLVATNALGESYDDIGEGATRVPEMLSALLAQCADCGWTIENRNLAYDLCTECAGYTHAESEPVNVFAEAKAAPLCEHVVRTAAPKSVEEVTPVVRDTTRRAREFVELVEALEAGTLDIPAGSVTVSEDRDSGNQINARFHPIDGPTSSIALIYRGGHGRDWWVAAVENEYGKETVVLTPERHVAHYGNAREALTGALAKTPVTAVDAQRELLEP